MSRLAGLAAMRPARRVDNAELARALCVDEGVIAGLGVGARYYAEAGQGPSHLAAVASVSALAEAGIGPADVQFLVFATMTPDVTFPGSGCYLQDKLGCATVGALDLRGQCVGFVSALEVAHQFLSAGTYENVLVAAGDVHSSGLDFTARGAAVTPLWGDGAAVAVLSRGGEGVLGTVLHSDASELERFWCEYPSSRRLPVRFLPSDLDQGKQFPRIDAEWVRRHDVERIPAAVDEVLAASSKTKSDVAAFVVQHVFPDVAEEAGHRLGGSGRTLYGGRDGGHVASASLAMTLADARARGDVKTGDLVCLATAGAGANWGAALVRI